jgi:ATP-dependent RNA helicase DDX27
LDIKNVETVINYETPQSHDIYLHRVGRTARAGRSGKAITIATESDRRIVRAVVKAGRAQGAQIASRVVPVAEADAWADRLTALEPDVASVLVEEREERALGVAERELRKSENLVAHEDEIMARPKRTWFESEKDKQSAKDKGRAELNGEIVLQVKGKPKKPSNKERKRLELKDERKETQAWKKGKTDAHNAGRNAKAKGPKADSAKSRGKPKTRGSSKPRGRGTSRGGGRSRGGSKRG